MLGIATNYDSYYPTTIHVNFNVNTPRIYMSVMQIIINLVSQKTRDIIKVFGVDNSEWVPVLLKNIDRNQLPKAYGGTGKF